MKKLAVFVAALMLTLGLAQCKKEQPSTTESEPKTIHITVNVGGSSKHVVDPSLGTVTYENGDVLYVGDGSHYIGTLICADGAFSGDIIEPTGENPQLHLYFVGGPEREDLTPGSTTSFNVDISNQSSNLPVLSYTSVPYTGATGSYSCILENKCALVKFVPATATGETVTIGGVYNTTTINFATPGITPTGDPGNITLYPESDAAKWAILLPQTGVSATATISGYNCFITSFPDVDINDYHTAGVSITMWDGDLSKLTSESTEAFATAINGMTITGTLGVAKKISIADGATVTLNGATINNEDLSNDNAGIVCQGDAIIVLEDGTENYVKGYNNQGIAVPANKTLTIRGTGQLTAIGGHGAGIGSKDEYSQSGEMTSGNIRIEGGTIIASGSSVGIGAGACATGGNIEITGGNITANGTNGPGIGAANFGSCGTITISGGTVTANGNGDNYGAGIGTSLLGTCGLITITNNNNVTSVTAKKSIALLGLDCKCIGKGHPSSTCAGVTIGGVDYGTGVDSNQDDDMTFIYPKPAGLVTWTMSSSFICDTEHPHTEEGITATLVAGLVTGEGNSGEATWEINGDYGNIRLFSGMDYSSGYPPTYVPSSLSFTSSVGKITKIVFLCINLPPSWPDGWSGIENEMPTPSEFKWEGTPAQTVTLSVTDYYFMISGITKIRFNIEEE